MSIAPIGYETMKQFFKEKTVKQFGVKAYSQPIIAFTANTDFDLEPL